MVLAIATLTVRVVGTGPGASEPVAMNVQLHADIDDNRGARVTLSIPAMSCYLLFNAEQLERAVRAMRICAETDGTKAGE